MLFAACKGLRQTGAAKKYDLFILPLNPYITLEWTSKARLRGLEMTGLSVLGFVFGMIGIAAFVGTKKLIKTLKEKGVLDQTYQKEQSLLGFPILFFPLYMAHQRISLLF